MKPQISYLQNSAGRGHHALLHRTTWNHETHVRCFGLQAVYVFLFLHIMKICLSKEPPTHWDVKCWKWKERLNSSIHIVPILQETKGLFTMREPINLWPALFTVCSTCSALSLREPVFWGSRWMLVDMWPARSNYTALWSFTSSQRQKSNAKFGSLSKSA